jgi:hypothetical protein
MSLVLSFPHLHYGNSFIVIESLAQLDGSKRRASGQQSKARSLMCPGKLGRKLFHKHTSVSVSGISVHRNLVQERGRNLFARTHHKKNK